MKTFNFEAEQFIAALPYETQLLPKWVKKNFDGQREYFAEVTPESGDTRQVRVFGRSAFEAAVNALATCVVEHNLSNSDKWVDYTRVFVIDSFFNNISGIVFDPVVLMETLGEDQAKCIAATIEANKVQSHG